jgi:hypothetical protein
LFSNLFAVPTPLGPNAAPSAIEDLFEDPLKNAVVSGKTFNPGNALDPDKHYGKRVFAHRVVRPQADTINFTGFMPLLANLVAALGKHKASIATV